jgi:hypothetical protein
MNINLSDFLITNQTPNKKQFTNHTVSKHNTPEDCLISINGKVYDITKYSNDLEKKNKDRTLAVNCGSIFTGLPSQVFTTTTNYNDYEIGEIQNYFLKKFIYLGFMSCLYMASIYFGLHLKTDFYIKNNYSIIWRLIAGIIFYIITYMIFKYLYNIFFNTNLIKFNNDYIEKTINPPKFNNPELVQN